VTLRQRVSALLTPRTLHASRSQRARTASSEHDGSQTARRSKCRHGHRPPSRARRSWTQVSSHGVPGPLAFARTAEPVSSAHRSLATRSSGERGSRSPPAVNPSRSGTSISHAGISIRADRSRLQRSVIRPPAASALRLWRPRYRGTKLAEADVEVAALLAAMRVAHRVTSPAPRRSPSRPR